MRRMDTRLVCKNELPSFIQTTSLYKQPVRRHHGYASLKKSKKRKKKDMNTKIAIAKKENI